MLPARSKNRMCSHLHAGDAIAEKIAEKNHEKFNVLNFSRENTILSCHLCEVGYTCDFPCTLVMRYFRKITSPSLAKIALVATDLLDVDTKLLVKSSKTHELCVTWW